MINAHPRRPATPFPVGLALLPFAAAFAGACAEQQEAETNPITSPQVRELHQAAVDCGYSDDYVIQRSGDAFSYNPEPATRGDAECFDAAITRILAGGSAAAPVEANQSAPSVAPQSGGRNTGQAAADTVPVPAQPRTSGEGSREDQYREKEHALERRAREAAESGQDLGLED